MLKIEFDASNKALAAAIGAALFQYGDVAISATVEETKEAKSAPEKSFIEKVHDIVEKTGETTVKVSDADTGEVLAEETVDTAAAFSNEKEPANDGPVDELGTPHEKKYCGPVDAAVPFYASGPNKGQWKRKRGVDESAYNEWYASAVPIEGEDEPQGEETVDTSAAFGGQVKQETQPSNDGAPATAGELMKYISERQAGGTLDQPTVTQAYTDTGVQLNDLFDASKEADAVAKLYACLSNR